ncbi:50S ribosomal protein L23 [Candidatus Bathyarchaeota archaeon]|nr:50S ribosomal protein L23 [Candidatus Bathyarchaeota archaeon]
MEGTEAVKSEDVILYPMMTEVASRLIESENKLIFVVNMKATKKDVRKAVEELYQVKVRDVNIAKSAEGEKKAFVRLQPEYSATDVAIKLGLL